MPHLSTVQVDLQDPTGPRLPIWKRMMDVALVALALPALVPVLGAVALAVRLSGPGPVLFVQTRIGQGGRPFRMVKFRSMIVGADSLHITVPGDRDGICFKMARDPRITRVGAFLRRSSLDELPQLFNVLRGEMSLVDPRPALPDEVARYPAHAHARHAVPPGITGTWQVAGRAEVGFDQMIDMDLAYASDLRFATDLRLLWRTFEAVITGRGAW